MKNYFLVMIAFIVCFSCSDDDVILEAVDNYYALEIGNIWTYENFQYSVESQTYEETGVIDVVSITGIETIFGDDYYIQKTVTTGNDDGILFCNPNGEKIEYIRAYEGYLIDDNSNVVFVNNVYEPILEIETSQGDFYFQLSEVTETITIAAGVFECQKMYRYFDHNEEDIWNGRHNFYYADGVGLVLETPSSIAAEVPNIERRLVSYTIQ